MIDKVPLLATRASTATFRPLNNHDNAGKPLAVYAPHVAAVGEEEEEEGAMFDAALFVRSADKDLTSLTLQPIKRDGDDRGTHSDTQARPPVEQRSP